MTWLKKIGQVVLKIFGIGTQLLPLLAPTLGATATDKLGAAFNAVVTAEQMFTAAAGPDAKTGSQKLAAVKPYVATLVQDTLKELTGKAQPKDEAKFEAAVTQITGALADALNSYGD